MSAPPLSSLSGGVSSLAASALQERRDHQRERERGGLYNSTGGKGGRDEERGTDRGGSGDYRSSGRDGRDSRDSRDSRDRDRDGRSRSDALTSTSGRSSYDRHSSGGGAGGGRPPTGSRGRSEWDMTPSRK